MFSALPTPPPPPPLELGHCSNSVCISQTCTSAITHSIPLGARAQIGGHFKARNLLTITHHFRSRIIPPLFPPVVFLCVCCRLFPVEFASSEAQPY